MPSIRQPTQILPSATAIQHEQRNRIVSYPLRKPSSILPEEFVIDCPVYGKQSIREPALIALILSDAVQRLKDVLQHGITGVLGMTGLYPVTRYNHSVGAMLMVRKLGGSIECQAAALLHDIGHTSLSHVLDSVYGYVVHEDDKHEYLQTTNLPTLLNSLFPGRADHILEESNYPLVERDPPKLCADRGDYGLRDALVLSHLDQKQVTQIVDDLAVYNGEICMRTPAIAKEFALAYMDCDKSAWANERHGVLYIYAARAISLAIKRKLLDKTQLWTYSDLDFWRLFTHSPDADVRKLASYVRPDIETIQEPDDTIEGGHLEDADGEVLGLSSKLRTIDPDVLICDCDGKPTGTRRLSQLDDEYKSIRDAYISIKSSRRKYRARLPRQ